MYKIYLEGGRIYFRPIDEDDQYWVVKWRNTKSARESFFTHDVVTPGTHDEFVKNKDPHDLVWIAEGIFNEEPIGMTAIKVHDPSQYIGEYGRTYVDEAWRGQGYAKEIEYLMLWAAFEWLQLDSLWLEAYVTNEPIIKLHYATGWMVDEVITHDDKDVARMIYKRDWWKTNRLIYADKFGVELPEWEA